jgi:hypothetical protein
MSKNTVDLAMLLHADTHGDVKQIGQLCLAIIHVVSVSFECGFSEITKYGNFSHLLMDFHKTKFAIRFYDLENIFLYLSIMQK